MFLLTIINYLLYVGMKLGILSVGSSFNFEEKIFVCHLVN